MKTTKSASSRNATKAFTLIELLVVIAIIAILAAILFPVFARARENARRSSCQSNLKQIGLGIMQYTQDYDEYLPNDANWAEQTFPYVKSTQIYTCPSDSYRSPVFPEVRPTSSYAMNANFIRNFGTARPINIAALSSTVLTVMTAEVTGSNAYSLQMLGNIANGEGQGQPSSATSYVTGLMGGPTANAAPFTATITTAEPRHLGGSNFLAADGHVKWLRGEKISIGQDAVASNQAQGGCGGPCAAGTDSMRDSAGGSFALTYSIK